MVVVLEELAHGHDVQGQRVPRAVAIVEAPVTVSVAAPVDDRPMDGTQDPLHGQQRPLPPVGREEEVRHRVERAPADAHRP